MQLARLLCKAKPSSYANRLLHHFSSTSKCESHLLNFTNPNPYPHITSLFSIRPFSTDNDNNNNNNSKNGDRNFTSSGHDLWNHSPLESGDFKPLTSNSRFDDNNTEDHNNFNHQWTVDREETDDKFFDPIAGITGTMEDDNSAFKDDKELSAEEIILLQQEEKQLLPTLQGPNRAFGDLISASGITDEMLDTLIALKDFEGVDGLPPLREIEDLRYEKNTRKSTRAEIELQKQENIAKSRVRQVDEKGRSYGTGRRKTSVARVWVQPGHGNFLVNDKQFDVYFPMLDHRAALLRPFAETKTLGLWDVHCTVKGGGVSGQVGAIQLGISRALQNWEPDLHPALKSAGFLTRDPRVVERKKPGKAKARKSFQWVKR